MKPAHTVIVTALALSLGACASGPSAEELAAQQAAEARAAEEAALLVRQAEEEEAATDEAEDTLSDAE